MTDESMNETVTTTVTTTEDDSGKTQFVVDLSEFVTLMVETVGKLERRVIQLEIDVQAASKLHGEIEELRDDTQKVLKTAEQIRDGIGNGTLVLRNKPPSSKPN